MKPLGKAARIKVLDFMRSEFGNAMVMDLKPSELLRTRRYVETIHHRMNREKTQ